ncbi:hypothetical protein HRbin15_02372 [bacterium HR15]|nr:hypothetical protein HRbin15_02372 [bacterium HR15]
MQEMHHYDYTIGLPQRWIDASVVVMVGPPNDNYSPSITITRDYLDFAMSASEYAANQLVGLKTELGGVGYRVVEEGTTTIGGLPAYQRLHTFQMPEGGFEITQLQVYVVRGREAITITCTNLSQWFEQTRPLFAGALQQFRWHAASSGAEGR